MASAVGVLLLVSLATNLCRSELPDTCQNILSTDVNPTGDLSLAPPPPQQQAGGDPGPGGPSLPSSLAEYLQQFSQGPGSNNTCYNLTLLPGMHSFSLAMAISVPGSIAIIASSLGEVEVEFRSAMARTSVLQLQNMGYLEVRGISFTSSSGFLSFENIHTLVIDSCTFR